MPAITLHDKGKFFVLKDSTGLKNIQELHDALDKMSDEDFKNYVSKDSNDFANWIEHVFEEKHFATALRKVKTRSLTKGLLKRFLDKGHFVHETIILGGGIAGMAAAIYAARKRMDYLILSPDFGGQMLVAGDIENYPGFAKTNWSEFMDKFKEQMKVNEIEFVEESAKEIKKLDDGHFMVITEQNKYETESVIICTGARARKLGVPGEDKFEKKGVTYCAICDGPLFKGKDVVVVGGGDAALEAADFLMRIATKIYLVTINPKMMGHEYLIERITGQDVVEVVGNAKTTEILGDTFVTGLKLEQNGKERTLDVQGIFVEIGRIPNTEVAKGLCDMDKHGHIIVDREAKTTVDGIWAAGDCTDIHEYQFSISAGQAVTALLKAARWLAAKKQ